MIKKIKNIKDIKDIKSSGLGASYLYKFLIFFIIIKKFILIYFITSLNPRPEAFFI